MRERCHTQELALGLVLATVISALGVRGEIGKEPVFTNDDGWVWHLKPSGAGADWTSANIEGLAMRLDELKSGKLLLTLAHTEEATRDIVRFRPVAFNASGQRFEFTRDSGGSTEGVALEGYLLDLKILPREEVKYLGLEKLTKDNLRDVVAPAAFQKLKNSGTQALPFPRIGERYDFELATIDGKQIGSREVHGKVVLLDFWARWCGPCMVKLPKLKETYRKLNNRGFEVVGLNHDWTLEEAKRTIAQQELPWPNVLAPTNKDQRELWLIASGTGALPRLLLIDRDGILRADILPQELDKKIEKLIEKP